MSCTCIRLAVIAAVLMIAGPSSASAWGGGPPGHRLARACHLDAVRLCPGVLPGDGRILRCLSEQRDRLTEPCYRALATAAAIEACSEDFRHFCPGTVPGAGRGLACLEGNRDRLSPACRRSLKAAAPRLYARRFADGPASAPPPAVPPPAYEPPDLSEAPLK